MQQCMLGAMDEFCTMLVPSMHCSIIIFFMVTIVEVHKLILDVCVSLVTTIDVTILPYLYINWLSQNYRLVESLLL